MGLLGPSNPDLIELDAAIRAIEARVDATAATLRVRILAWLGVIAVGLSFIGVVLSMF